MKRIAIIPARGGSKRIPGKNIKDFFGKPIIAYAIELAINSKLFDQVFVSTDSKEIRDISISHGANVSFYRSTVGPVWRKMKQQQKDNETHWGRIRVPT